MDKSRFKNYGLWVSILALIPMVLQGFNLNILPANYGEIVNAILAILVMAGILSNPNTDNKWFSDDTKVEELPEDTEASKEEQK